MSSLAAARADNFYYPPGWDPSKGSINKFQGQHPLRERAKKIGEGILVIRFEMPFNMWCAGCNHLIGKGVRFNAEKKAVGNYHSTKIWSFKMKAPCCGQRIEIHTDPKSVQYIIVSGGRQKEETWTAQDAETMELPDKEDKPRLDDPFYKLEHGNEDKRRGRETAARVTQLRLDSEVKYKDDYTINKLLRRQMRAKRKELKAADSRRNILGLPDTVTLLPESAEDVQLASLVNFGDDRAYEKSRQLKRQQICEGSIFSAPPARATASSVIASASANMHAGSSGQSPADAPVRVMSTSCRRLPPSRLAVSSRVAKRSGISSSINQKAAAHRKRLGLGVKLGLSNPI